MKNSEVMLECLKLGLALTSPTVADRTNCVVETAKLLYSECIALDSKNPDADTSGQKPRGRPPKPRAE